MKTKITTIATLALIVGIGAWQVTSLNRSNNQAAIIKVATSNTSELPACKSAKQLSELKVAVQTAQSELNTVNLKARATKTSIDTYTKQLATQAAYVKTRAQAVTTASTTLLAKQNALEKTKTPATEKAVALAAQALSSAIRSYDQAVVYKTDLEAKLKAAQEEYKQYVVPTGKKLSPLAEAKTQSLALAKANLAKATALKATCPKTEATAQCTDSIDNDRDGTADCMDSECSTTQACKDQAKNPEVPPTTDGGNKGGNGTTTPGKNKYPTDNDPRNPYRFLTPSACQVASGMQPSYDTVADPDAAKKFTEDQALHPIDCALTACINTFECRDRVAKENPDSDVLKKDAECARLKEEIEGQKNYLYQNDTYNPGLWEANPGLRQEVEQSITRMQQEMYDLGCKSL